MKRIEKSVSNSISKEDVNNICALSIDPRYKSLEKLYENVIINLVQKSLKECEKESEFLGVKWAVSVCKLWLLKPKEYYLTSLKNANNKGTKAGTAKSAFEDLPDGTYGTDI